MSRELGELKFVGIFFLQLVCSKELKPRRSWCWHPWVGRHQTDQHHRDSEPGRDLQHNTVGSSICGSEPFLAELGTRQHFRDIGTTFSGQKWLFMVLCLHSLWQVFKHRGLKIFNTFSCLRSSITLSRCCCREAKKLSRAQLCLEDNS